MARILDLIRGKLKTNNNENKMNDRLGYSIDLRDREFSDVKVILSDFIHIDNCKFSNCKIIIPKEDRPLFRNVIFEDCNIEIEGYPYNIIAFDKADPCIFINTKIDLVGDEYGLKSFLNNGKPEFKEVFKEEDLDLLEYCFGDCTYNGKPISFLIEDIKLGMYGTYFNEEKLDNTNIFDKKDFDIKLDNTVYFSLDNDNNIGNNSKNIKYKDDELKEAEKSLGIGDEFIGPRFVLDDTNREIVSKNIDKIDLSNFTSSNEIEIIVAPSKKDIKVDWSKLLNSITDRGYKVSIKIDCFGQNINNSIEKEDIVLKILKDKEKIKNKDLIKIGYYYEKFGKNYNDYELNISEYNNVEEVLDLCARDAEEKGFSPLEKLIVAYKVTVGMFMGNFSKEKVANSFDKYSSIMMFPEVKPVCQVYTQLFETLCQKLNISCKVFKFKANEHENHVVDIVKVNDEKYNIHGTYLMDITLIRDNVNEYINEMLESGKKPNNYMPVSQNLFCLGQDDANILSIAYKLVTPETWKEANLSKTGIPKEIFNQAAKVVNEATMTNIKTK